MIIINQKRYNYFCDKTVYYFLAAAGSTGANQLANLLLESTVLY